MRKRTMRENVSRQLTCKEREFPLRDFLEKLICIRENSWTLTVKVKN